jgi:hypothetical protein
MIFLLDHWGDSITSMPWLGGLTPSALLRIALSPCPMDSDRSITLLHFVPLISFSSNWQCFCLYNPITLWVQLYYLSSFN